MGQLLVRVEVSCDWPGILKLKPEIQAEANIEERESVGPRLSLSFRLGRERAFTLANVGTG